MLHECIVMLSVFLQEIITEMRDMVKDMMIAFRRTNHGVFPEHILFYRDGVSEGQFRAVSVQSVAILFQP